MDTRESLERFLVSYPELCQAERVAIAFSGGADSLSLLITMRKRFPSLQLVPIYVDHNLRSRDELDREIALNRNNCSRLGCKLLVKTIERGKVEELAKSLKVSTEASARLLRYELLEEEEADFILTAHTRSDQIELLFMRMLTGSSLKALVGIRPRRGIFMRPLIFCERKDTVRCCQENSFLWAEDSTNDTDFCFRNRIRHQIDGILSVEERDTLVRIAENLRVAEEREMKVCIIHHRRWLEVLSSEYLSAGPFSRNSLLEDVYSSYESDRMSDGKKRKLEGIIKRGGRAEFRHFIAIGDGKKVRIFPRIPLFSSKGELPCGLELVRSAESDALRFSIEGPVVFRLSEDGDQIQLKDGVRKVSSLLSEYGVPYAIVVEVPEGIAMLFSSFIGGRNRLASRYLDVNSSQSEGWKVI
ncbi:MAG: tRNA lysidine(34) synthetase TilS [Spirochaetales bacterium]|nr:tRNA lysidine(34) synthetase TilS [Spirochaetales bacterium]